MNWRIPSTLTAGFASLLALSPAADITVPGDFATIQEAIDAADNGDRILLSGAPLYQTPTLEIEGKSLTIESVPPGARIRGAIPTASPYAWGLYLHSQADLILIGVKFDFDYSHIDYEDERPVVLSQDSHLTLSGCHSELPPNLSGVTIIATTGGTLQIVDGLEPGEESFRGIVVSDLHHLVVQRAIAENVDASNVGSIIVEHSALNGRDGESAWCFGPIPFNGGHGSPALRLTHCTSVSLEHSSFQGGKGGDWLPGSACHAGGGDGAQGVSATEETLGIFFDVETHSGSGYHGTPPDEFHTDETSSILEWPTPLSIPRREFILGIEKEPAVIIDKNFDGFVDASDLI